jgi:uncharacterized membrane protein (Fun14 family)
MITEGLRPVRPTLMESVKNLDAQGVVTYFRTMQVNWMEVGMFGAMGLLSGFLFRKYFQLFVVCTILGVGLIAGLDYFGMIHIDWNAVNGMVGTTPTQNVDNIFQSAMAWMKVNVALITSFAVGFIAGFKVG